MRLIGLLLVVILTFGLTALVADKVMSTDQKEIHSTLSVLTTSSVPGSTTSGTGTPGSGAPPATTRTTLAPSPVSTAQRVSCVTGAASITSAEQAYQALNGTYTDIAGLLSAHLLEPSSSVPYTVVLGPGDSTYRLQGIGACS